MVHAPARLTLSLGGAWLPGTRGRQAAELQEEERVCVAAEAHTEQGQAQGGRRSLGVPRASAFGLPQQAQHPRTQAQAVAAAAQAWCSPQSLGPQHHGPDVLKWSENPGAGVLVEAGTWRDRGLVTGGSWAVGLELLCPEN